MADRGTFYAYIQQLDFYIGTRVKALESKFSNCNKYILNYIANSINKQAIRFSYGYNATNKTEKIKFLLPAIDDKPNYSYMEQVMKNIEYKQMMKYVKYLETA